MTGRGLLVAALGLGAAIAAGFPLAELPLPVAAATTTTAALVGLVYGARSALPSFQAAADGRRANVPWWTQVVIVLGIVALEQLLPRRGIVGPIVVSFVLILVAASFVYSGVNLRQRN